MEIISLRAFAYSPALTHALNMVVQSKVGSPFILFPMTETFAPRCLFLPSCIKGSVEPLVKSNQILGKPYDGLASYPGGVVILQVTSSHRIQV